MKVRVFFINTSMEKIWRVFFDDHVQMSIVENTIIQMKYKLVILAIEFIKVRACYDFILII